MIKTRVLITVKTYPNPSVSHGETVCTAGLDENANWVRMYPIPFRISLEEDRQFKKFQWVSVSLIKRSSSKDIRPESHTPQDGTLELHNIISTADKWSARKDFILGKGKVYDDMGALIKMAHDNVLSLATYKPKAILDFYCKECDGEWTDKQQAALNGIKNQVDYLARDIGGIGQLKKIPFEFRFRFMDRDGKVRDLLIEDWEVGVCYLNALKTSLTPKEAADKVVKKYSKIFKENDTYFFVGTTLANHIKKSVNPFIIIGLFAPPFDNRMELNL